jgi:hypothetical protein
MHTVARRKRKHKLEDWLLLKLLHSRRYRLESEMACGWDRSRSLELDLVSSLEESVLIGIGRRLGMQ